MKKILIIICAALITVAQAQTKKTTTTKKTTGKIVFTPPKIISSPLLKTALDTFSYAIGLEGASYYKSQGATAVNSALIKKAFDDVYGNKPLLLTPEQSTMSIQTKLMSYMNEKNAPQRDFLVQNKKRKGVVELPSGLQYEIIKQGAGEKPKATDTVKANYALSLINGQEIQSSFKSGQPLVIPVSSVIPGWVQALQLMPVGSKWKLYIPSNLGYGDRGAGAAIPGGSTLIFEIELLEIVNRPK